MKASLSWLRELLPELGRLSPDEVAKKLTQGGLEVEGVHVYGAGTEGCVVATVVSMRPHPTKSGLRLVTVEVAGGTQQEIVCGAPNVPEPGFQVVLALLGAHLPAKGMTIARREIAGVVSEGMLCSETELGLSEEGEGILVLPKGFAAPGTKLPEAIPQTNDTIYEIGLTPNRPDGLGHVGLARDLAAVLGLAFRAPERPAFGDPGVALDVPITIEAPERCPEFSSARATGIVVGPSPLVWRYRLLALGVRPISTLVDVTNLVLLGYGQPMHAFDLAKVRGRKIVVRTAKEAEPFTTLDGVARKLSSDDLVVCDGEGPVALAGVMGGENSEISASTTEVLFECAYFDARGIRRSSRRHGLHTEASHRFERGTDPCALRDALAYAVELTCEVSAGARFSAPVYVVGAKANATPREVARATAEVHASFMNRILGVEVPVDEASAILERLGCAVSPAGPGVLRVSAPTHRPDLTREIDFVEEVIRVRGIDGVPAVLPAVRGSREVGGREDLERRVRAACARSGLSEAITFRFTSEKALEAVRAPKATVVLENPINDHQTVMRTSLLPGLLEVVSESRRRGVRSAALFAVGPVFLEGAPLPDERPELTIVLAGDRPAYLQKPEAYDVWDAKGVAFAVLTELFGRAPEVVTYPAESRPEGLHPRAAGKLLVGDVAVGSFGLLHPDVTDAFDLPEAVPVVTIDLRAAAGLGVAPKYKAIPRFPASPRDLAVVVSDDVPAGHVLEAIASSAGALAAEVTLFDRFVGANIPKDHASLAFRVVYRSDERTLTDTEVEKTHARVVSEIGERFGAKLRS